MKTVISTLIYITLIGFTSKLYANSVSIRDISANSGRGLMDIRSVTKAEMTLRRFPDDLNNRVKLSEHYISLGNTKRVREILEPVQTKIKRRGQLILAEAYEKQSKYLDQLRVYQYLIGKMPKDFYVHFLMAKTYLKLGKNDESVMALKAAVDANKRYLPAWELWLNVLKTMPGRNYEARILVNDMIETFGPKSKFITEMCFLYYTDGFIEQAVEMCQMGIQRSRNKPDNYVYLGLAFRNSGEAKKAKRLLDKAGKRFPASELAQWAAAQISEDSNDLLSAESHLKKAVKADSRSERSQLMLAEVLFKLQKYKEALKHYKKHCALKRAVSPEFKLSAGKLLKINMSLHRKYNNTIAFCSRN